MIEQMPEDFLTGFFTRESLSPFLSRLSLESANSNKSFSIALIDLDHFKKYNDKYGHTFGDEILKYATSTIRLTFQEAGCRLFRYGGDEFIAIFPGKQPQEVLRLLRACGYNLRHRRFLFKNKLYRIRFSCGVVGFPGDEKMLEKLIKRADQAMYFSKTHGRNQITLAGRMKYLKFRSILVIAGSVCVIGLSVLISYHQLFKNALRSGLLRMESLKIVTKPELLDTVILKNGEIFEGRIIEETNQRVILSLYLTRGEGATVFNKSEISSIKYASESLPQEDADN